MGEGFGEKHDEGFRIDMITVVRGRDKNILEAKRKNCEEISRIDGEIFGEKSIEIEKKIRDVREIGWRCGRESFGLGIAERRGEKIGRERKGETGKRRIYLELASLD